MSTSATRSMHSSATLHLAFDLGNRIWKLAFATSIAHAPRLRTIPARDLAQLDIEIRAAIARFGLGADVPVVTCYEAGRDGFWLHRALTARGLTSWRGAGCGASRRARSRAGTGSGSRRPAADSGGSGSWRSPGSC